MDYEQTFAGFFNRAADEAAKICLHYFRHEIQVEDKEDQSPVTKADREIERKLRAMINEDFPTHGIIGEEFGSEQTNAEFVWCLDPIDGTKSFITGRPMFGTLIGLLHNGWPVAGMMDQAFTKERWFGITDLKATFNGKPIKVAALRKLEEARLYIGSINMFEGERFDDYLALCRKAKLTQYACDCYAYGLLGMGWADVVVEQKLKIFDVAAVAPIITGAGGYISDFSDRAIGKDFAGTCIAASSKELADQTRVFFKK